ncbi:MAG: flagellar protein FlaG [Oxalobacteraceae bacterium]|nr:flagellar protein FlaG [Oxalobacteraceae bacterium]
MALTIQAGTPSTVQPVSARPVTEVAQAAQPAAMQSTPAQRPAVTTPKKAEIQVDPEAMRKNLQEAIGRINEMVSDGGRGLHFSIDNATNAPVILVKNRESGEVIRQIPNEVVIKVAHSIEALKGLLHNEAV